MGYAVGTQCLSDPLQAAALFCGGVAGTSANGTHACTAASLDAHTLTWTLEVHALDVSTARTVVQQVAPCTPRDFDYYGPIIGAWFLACVVILGIKLIARNFRREQL